MVPPIGAWLSSNTKVTLSWETQLSKVIQEEGGRSNDKKQSLRKEESTRNERRSTNIAPPLLVALFLMKERFRVPFKDNT